MSSLIARIRETLARLSGQQKALLAAVILSATAAVIGTAWWASQPEYALLFGDLQPESANRIVETLRQEGTAYELRNGGSAVYVPRSKVHELRLQFSSQGTPDSGQEGYELFDGGTLGMTDFMQQLNSKRALEGELAETIQSIKGVDQARVHLVRPEDDPFEEQQTQASASVVIGSGASGLSQPQVRGISRLVAGATEGLSLGQVTVLDSRGNTLSERPAESESARRTSTQMELRRSVEEQLSEQAQSMLSRVLGREHAVVRVSAELDFDQSVTTTNQIDPESATVISEERTLGRSPDTTTSRTTVRNYEVSRTEKRTEEGVGEISRLTVSVVVDEQPAAGPDGKADGNAQEVSYEPRSEEQLQKIESLVKNAVGFDPDRGDQFTIQQTRFTGGPARAGPPTSDQQEGTPISLYFRYGLILLAIGAAVWIARTVIDRLADQAPPSSSQLPSKERQKKVDEGDRPEGVESGETPAALEGESEEAKQLIVEDDVYRDKLSDEAKARLEARSEMFEEIQEQAEQRPEQTAELIRSWLIEDRQEQVA